ncbi:MAG: DUF4837 family protein [Candidatus Krumholzibacteriia bacterium]
MRLRHTCLILAMVLGLGACGYDKEKPIFMAPGSYGDIAIVVSDAALEGALDGFKAAINQEYTFVISRENLFNLDVYGPDRWELCKGYKNIIVLWRVGDTGPVEKEMRHLLTDAAQARAASGSGVVTEFVEPYASYQFGVVVSATDRNSLLSFATREAAGLRARFEAKSSERIMRRYRFEGLDTQLMADLWTRHRFYLEIPGAYRLNQELPDGYPGVELMRTGPSRGITVAWSQSVDPQLVVDYKPLMVELRRELGLKMHHEDIVEDSLVWVEDTVGERSAWRLEGAWTSRQFDGGGPFWCWFLPDPDNQRVICIDALCYAPGLDKMDYFRRMRTIVQTFSLQRPQP